MPLQNAQMGLQSKKLQKDMGIFFLYASSDC